MNSITLLTICVVLVPVVLIYFVITSVLKEVGEVDREGGYVDELEPKPFNPPSNPLVDNKLNEVPEAPKAPKAVARQPKTTSKTNTKSKRGRPPRLN